MRQLLMCSVIFGAFSITACAPAPRTVASCCSAARSDVGNPTPPAEMLLVPPSSRAGTSPEAVPLLVNADPRFDGLSLQINNMSILISRLEWSLRNAQNQLNQLQLAVKEWARSGKPNLSTFNGLAEQ